LKAALRADFTVGNTFIGKDPFSDRAAHFTGYRFHNRNLVGRDNHRLGGLF
jgi:hypothetical protein